MALALLALSATSAPAEDAAGSLGHCPRHAVRSKRLKCSDGLSACDLDDNCDGTCLLAWCVDFIAACRPPRLRLCRIGEPPAVIAVARAGTKVGGQVPVADNVATRYAVRCKPARGCLPDPTGCLVALTGARTEQSDCRSSVLYDPGHTSMLVLTRTNGEGLLVFLGAPLGVGVYSSSVPPVASMVYGVVQGGTVAPAYAVDAAVGGSLTLTVKSVEPSVSIDHHVHGVLDATLVPVAAGVPVPGGAPLVVHATF